MQASLSTHRAARAVPSLCARFSSSSPAIDRIRNIAIVAHVDHGKTSLCDCILKQCAVDVAEDRVMDSMALERERGITISSKITSVPYTHDDKEYLINLLDTPGHAAFGGEVERVLSMADGILLVICSTEGPNTQSRFVAQKAIQRGLRPVVVLNKADRDSNRIGEVEDEVFDLLVALDATDEQLDFPIVYTSARDGWATTDMDNIKPELGMQPLLDAVISTLPQPEADRTSDFSMLVSMLGHDSYLGRVVTGRITTGSARVGDTVRVMDRDGKDVESSRITRMFKPHATTTRDIEHAEAGDIVQLAGLGNAWVTHTVCAPSVSEPLYAAPVDPPTISMLFSPNTSPLAGKDGTKLTSNMIGDRLKKETQDNVSIEVHDRGETYEVKGRGEMQLGILAETLRREGFELSVSPPKVLFHEEEGVLMEPVEEVVIDVDEAHVGGVMERLQQRHGEMQDMSTADDGRTRLTFRIPSRLLLGYRFVFTMDTQGRGVMNSTVAEYRPVSKSQPVVRHRGALVSQASGVATAYSLDSLQARGTLFIGPGTTVYEGMIIGEYNKESRDLIVNPTKAKQLTNVRASGTDDAVRLSPPRQFTLEEAISFIAPDEMLEITPQHVRMRKALLTENERKVNRKK